MNARRGPGDAAGARADVASVVGAAGSDTLLAFLRGKRWFGDKAAAISATLRDLVRLPWADGTFVVARVRVEVQGGAPRDYQVPLSARDGRLDDAVAEPAFLRHLAADLAHGASYEGEGGVHWVIGPEGAQGLVVPQDAPIRVGSAEQSNTSIVFDDEGILKLFRKLEPGQHPEVELTRYLSVEAAFAHTPTLLGTIRFEDPGGVITYAGMLQDYLPKSKDAWSDVLARGRAYFEPGGAHDLAPDIERLGRITREMHDALARATGDLAPVAATRADVEEWATATKAMVNRALDLLARSGTGARSPEAEILVKRRDAYLAWVDELVADVGGEPGVLTRIHGDYHLGQVLRAANGDFMIIDFEGEPARPLAERRRKASPMRDVAGMLRSLAYAAATLAREAGGGRREAAGDPQVEILAARWERDAREAFLAGYFGGGEARDGSALRARRPASRALLRLFETEKVFYELAYELNNRPDWAWIPMRGISKLLVRG